MSQQYQFAYGFLKQYAFQRTAELQQYLQTEGESFLTWLWQESAGKAPSQPCPGLAVTMFTHEQRPAVLITLPPPAKSPEAHFVLILFGTDPPDYYSLEKANGEFAPSGTMLGRWTPQGHENWGLGPEPEPDAFIESVFSLLQRQ